MLFPVWKIPKIVLGNDLSFPRTFTFDVPQSWVSKAGREGSEMAGMTLHIFISLFPNSTPPLISSSRCDSWDRQIRDGFCVVTAQNQRQPLAWVSPRALGMQLLQPGSSWSLSRLFYHHPAGCVHSSCSYRSIAEQSKEPEWKWATDCRALSLLGIRRKYLEESRVSGFNADFAVSHQGGSQPWINIHFLRSTATYQHCFVGSLLSGGKTVL